MGRGQGSSRNSLLPFQTGAAAYLLWVNFGFAVGWGFFFTIFLNFCSRLEKPAHTNIPVGSPLQDEQPTPPCCTTVVQRPSEENIPLGASAETLPSAQDHPSQSVMGF